MKRDEPKNIKKIDAENCILSKTKITILNHFATIDKI